MAVAKAAPVKGNGKGTSMPKGSQVQPEKASEPLTDVSKLQMELLKVQEEKKQAEIKLESLRKENKNKKLSATERLKQLDTLNQLNAKLTATKARYHELELFKAGADKMQASVILDNGNGGKFSITEPQVLRDIEGMLNRKLTAYVEEATSEIENFHI